MPNTKRVADALNRLGQGRRKPLAALAIAFKQVVGHALGALLSHAGQYPQGLDELLKQ